MRKHIALPLAAALALASTAAIAALDNSHHDLTVAGPGTATQVCFQCHGLTDSNDNTALIPDTGAVGALCIGRCHVGGSIAGNNAYTIPTAPLYPVYTADNAAADSAVYTNADILYFSNAHGRSQALLTDPWSGATVPFPATGAAYPYAGAAGGIECSTCHSVHDNANAPFIWDAWYAGGASFCNGCHTARATNTGDLDASAPDGNHPVNVTIATAAAAARNVAPGAATVGRDGRTISIDAAAPGRYFDVATPLGAALDGAGGADASSYILGGKISTQLNWTNANDGTENISCFTCHAVHSQDPFGQLIVSAYEDDGVVPTRLGQNPICMGCHGGGGNVADNYAYSFAQGGVGTSGYGHDLNGASLPTAGLTYTVTGGIVITIADPTAALTGYPSDLGPNGEVVCTSCHDIHGGKQAGTNGETIDSNIIWEGAPDPICVMCHTGVGLPDAEDVSETAGGGEGANAHHRTSTLDWTTVTTNGLDADALNMGNPSWFSGTNAAYGYGDLSDGLQCSDCHISNGTAHNW